MSEWICAASKSEGADDFEAKRFASEDAAYAWLETQDGKHCWITPNPVRQGVGKACDADVLRAPWQLVDVDPPADTERVAREIFEAFGRCGRLNFSGRGHQVLLRVAPDVDRRRLAQYVQSEWKVDKGVGQDVSRLTRAVGFRNPRTGEVAETLEEGEGEVTAAVLELLTADWVPPAEIEIRGWDPGPASAEDLAAIPPGARRVWDSENADRSHRLFAFVKECLKAGLAPERTCRLAIEMPDSKLADRDSAYWATTYASAAREVEKATTALQDLLDTLRGEDPAEDKVDALFAPEAIALAADVRGDPRQWAQLRLAVKKSRCCPVAEWVGVVRASSKELVGPPDGFARRLVGEDGKVVGWVKTNDGGELLNSEVRTYLRPRIEDVDDAMAAAMDASWTVVVEPFKPRELEGRRWNVSQAQWRVEPSPGAWPVIRRTLDAWGRGLDDAVRQCPWCREHGIASGGDYVFAWLACMAQEPAERVAWLFAFSRREGSGKSTLPELLAATLLSPGSVAEAASYFEGERPFFSREMRGAVLLTVEEINIAKHRKTAVPRFKTLVAAPYLNAEFKCETAFRIRNVTHVIQTANYADYAPIDPGDTRITAFEMAEFRECEIASKAELLEAWHAEAPAFLAALLAAEIPPGDGRLRVPAVATELKASQQEASESLLATWLKNHPEWVTLEQDALYQQYGDYASAMGESERWRTRQSTLRQIDSTASSSDRALFRLAKRVREIGDFEDWPTRYIAERVGGSAIGVGRNLSVLVERGFKIQRRTLRGGTLWTRGGD